MGGDKIGVQRREGGDISEVEEGVSAMVIVTLV